MNPTKRKVQNESTKGDPVITDLPLACADEQAAVEFMEKQRWGDKTHCPRCGDFNVYQMMDSKDPSKRQANFRWRCRGCKEQFTVRIGTVFEDSRAELRHWCFVFWRAATSKKGVSALEVHRQTGLSYKTCLFMLHRVRCAMDVADIEPLSGDVEVDEVYIGGKPRRVHGTRITPKKPKTAVVGMLQRGGKIRPRVVADVTGNTLKGLIRQNVHPSSRILTDEWSGYRGIGKEYAGGHHTVRHTSYEYVRGDVHTNSIEGFFGMLRRGLNGIYHSVSRKHLHRYLAEFEFRHNNRELMDGQRIVAAIRAAQGKRLTYAEQVGA